jgi:hypothetical protein
VAVVVAGSLFLFEKMQNRPPVGQNVNNISVPAPPQIAPPVSEPAQQVESRGKAAAPVKRILSAQVAKTADAHSSTVENPPIAAIPATVAPVEAAKADVPPLPAPNSNSPPGPQPAGANGTAPLRSTARGATFDADFGSGVRGNSAHTPAPNPAPVAPASIRLDAGTTLMILMSVVSPKKEDGSFVFRGTLVEPISQTGAHLSRGAEVRGYTTVSGGKTSVHVLEFLVSGTLYKLNGATGTANTRPPGTGRALQLEKGQVLETWLATVSVYDKAADKPSQPPPAK